MIKSKVKSLINNFFKKTGAYKALVIGGGVAGIYASLELLKNGYKVYLIEKESSLGGNLLKIYKTYPFEDFPMCHLMPLITKLVNNSDFRIFTHSEIHDFCGNVGNYKVQIIKKQTCEISWISIGVIIVATGYRLMDKKCFQEYAPDSLNVITSMDMEHMLSKTGPFQGELLWPYDKKKPEVISFISCVGSRDERYHSYCSRLCCMNIIKQAIIVKEKNPKIEIFVHFIDMRTPGLYFEKKYNFARELGINFIRGKVGGIEKLPDSKLRVMGFDADMGIPIEVIADMVVLSTAIEIQDSTKNIVDLLGLTLNNSEFIKVNDKTIGNVETSKKGIFVAGCCQSPKNISDTIFQARLAAKYACEVQTY